ncbi:iron chelate uptake ABC transporter family permease subunit, partial [Nevskia sp.]|uniref:iron chelate uptake ABC transporter family permease subunit n=1 Tax=Nevskia sp. TaxID=1929292 RepID=UPI0025FB9347
LMTGSAVALAGPIGFLGLIAPYAARAWIGVSLGRQLGYSVLIGAGLLLLADLAARLIVLPYEAPVSALLALLGAPLLILMVRRDALLSLSRIGSEA